MISKILITVCILALTPKTYSKESVILAVGQAKVKASKVYFQRPQFLSSFTSAERSRFRAFMSIVRNDFKFYKKSFEIYPHGKIDTTPQAEVARSTPNYTYWKAKGVDKLIKTSFLKEEGVSIRFNVFDINNQRQVFATSISVSALTTGHMIAHNLFKELTGTESIFLSRIVFISDQHSKARGKRTAKELYMMDFNGQNIKRLTYHQGIVVAPSFSPDNSQVIYSLLPRSGRVRQLYTYNIKSKRSKLLYSTQLNITGAVFTHDGRSLYLSMGKSGNTDIYKLDLKTKKLSSVIKHYAIDVDPSINRTDSSLAFLSNRSGRAHIYLADPRGVEKSVRRISFVGKLNAGPEFSPDGKDIVFASWGGRNFDLYRLNSSGKGLYRLTRNFGSNESPSFSPDSGFIVFSSKRVLSRKKIEQNLYIATRNGEVLQAVTQNLGNCQNPSWSN